MNNSHEIPSAVVNDGVVSKVGELVSCLNHCTSMNVFLENVHDIVDSITYADNFYVVLESGNDISFPYFKDTKDMFSIEELNQFKKEDINNSLTCYALKSHKPQNLDNVSIANLINDGYVNLMGTIPKQWLCFPLEVKNKSLGAFVVQSYRSNTEYSSYDFDLLFVVSHIIASALDAFNNQKALSSANVQLESRKAQLEVLVKEKTIKLEREKAKLQQEVSERAYLQKQLEYTVSSLQSEIAKVKNLKSKLEHEVRHDHLTGLYNRKELFLRLRKLASIANRKKITVYALYIDLNKFKAVNDKLSHEIGDELLIQVAKRFKDALRDYDLLCRVGGDEFVVLIDEQGSIESIESIAQRLTLAATKQFKIKGNIISIGAAIGVASGTDSAYITNKLIRHADEAMYIAKKQGDASIIWHDKN
ncbi:sensor domain-containing diguanylate cyclase [Pseudoalteromonas sp. G4]|uniref:sensor domain-containing diguanylate cyclase n=1 Tax=Pseudoalteromonas sp. G4 TaxID=2992761 RepID=UPI00237D5AD9|nr:sensor domain-containing diguanylate cyclase [Pseudoalteromonas sp. G4]MDE3273980.1 sensor domain-containing diguanylate cyclase [Pseudoalteromonas sp. G4]